MTIAALACAALAAFCPTKQPDAEAMRPIVATASIDGALACYHADGGVTIVDLGLVTSVDNQAAIIATDRLETAWKDAQGREHRVVTEYSADRDPVDVAKRHQRRVAAIEALYPPVPSKPQ